MLMGTGTWTWTLLGILLLGVSLIGLLFVSFIDIQLTCSREITVEIYQSSVDMHEYEVNITLSNTMDCHAIITVVSRSGVSKAIKG